MTNPAYEATNSDVRLIARTKQLSSLMVERFSMNPISAKILHEDWEKEFPDNESVAQRFNALIAALEQAQRQNKLHERAEFTFMNALNLPDTAGRNEILAGILAVNYSLSAANRHIAELESSPNGMMQLSNELAEMKRKFVELEASNNPMKFSESYDADECRDFAWEHVKGLLGTDGWTVGDSCNYFGFYCWGWDMRRQYNEQRAAGGTVEGD